VRFQPQKFTPDSGLYKGELCEGVKVVLVDRDALQAMRMGIEIAAALAKLYPGKFEPEKTIMLLGNAATIKQLASGGDPVAILASWNKELDAFWTIRAKYLLYH
jgi:uncharacterized protein YbbC (DUF1343 family)